MRILIKKHISIEFVLQKINSIKLCKFPSKKGKSEYISPFSLFFNNIPFIGKSSRVEAPNIHWQMDITYVTIFPRIIFILDIIDTYTLEIVGYKAGFSITKNDVVKIVTKAIASRHITDSLTIRTDNRPQFKLKEFQEFCTKQGIFHERIPVRSPERNPNIERFHRTLKEEYFNINDFASYSSFFKGLDDYIKFYLCERPHESANL